MRFFNQIEWAGNYWSYASLIDNIVHGYKMEDVIVIAMAYPATLPCSPSDAVNNKLNNW